MKTLNLIIIGLTLSSSLAWAAKSDPWSLEELRSRLEIVGEIYVMDATGKRVLKKGVEHRSWESRKGGKIESNWSSVVDDYEPIALHHEWEIVADGSLKVLIEQYAKVKGDGSGHDFEQLLKRQEITLENFEPVTWVAIADKDKRLVVRLTPRLRDETEAKALTQVPISGSEIVITDSRGQVWAENVGVQAPFAGFITHKGALFFSYYPFQGAVEMGTASGKKIQFELGGDRFVTLNSQTAFLPEGVRAKVYGKFEADRKTKRLRSIRTIGSSDEPQFLKSMAARD